MNELVGARDKFLEGMDAIDTALKNLAKTQLDLLGRIPHEWPEPHHTYVMCRDNKLHTCTVCYGMHDPWWIVHMLNGREDEPTPMRIGDLFCRVESFMTLPDMLNRE